MSPILPLRVPTFSAATRGMFPDLASEFDEHEQLTSDYEPRFCSRYVCQGSPGAFTLRDKALIALFSAFARARQLAWDVIYAINSRREPSMFLCTRAHFEMTGYVAYLLTKLEGRNAGKVSDEEMDAILDKLYLGHRFEITPRTNHPLEATNALTLVEAVDPVIENASGMFKKQYEFLCEFCHPNLYGRMSGETLSEGVYSLDEVPRLAEDMVRIALNSLAVSHPVFLSCFAQVAALVGGTPPTGEDLDRRTK